MMRRGGRPGLIGMAARTAVVAGTATAVSGRVSRRQAGRQQAAADEQAAADADDQQMADMQAQLDDLQANQAPAAAPAAAPASGTDDLLSQLQKLADLKSAGILDDAEFAAAKAKLLA